jgi:hypothetical protein
MTRISPLQLMLIGFVLMVIGILLPLAMVLRIVEPTLELGFLAYGASILGLVLGVLGVVQFSRTR